jgi:hypothetical protein
MATNALALSLALRKNGIEMIAPNRSNRMLKQQDGRRLRRWERRWLVARYCAWLQWQGRLLDRCEYYAADFLGLLSLAASTMLPK